MDSVTAFWQARLDKLITVWPDEEKVLPYKSIEFFIVKFMKRLINGDSYDILHPELVKCSTRHHIRGS